MASASLIRLFLSMLSPLFAEIVHAWKYAPNLPETFTKFFGSGFCIFGVIPRNACGGSAKKDSFTVGICQLVQHPALDAATEGFKEALTAKLGDKVTFLEQNASGDSATCATICNQFVSEQVDLIMEENRLTTLMITHNMKDAIRHGNRLIMMNQGKIILDIEGEEKKNLTKQMLMEMFQKVSGSTIDSDEALLTK